MPIFIRYPDDDTLINIKEISSIEQARQNVYINLVGGLKVTARYGTDGQATAGFEELEQMIRHAMLYSNPFPPSNVSPMPEIKYRKLANIPDLEKINKGDWIDLSVAWSTPLKAGEYGKIPLGIAMELPAGYEALVVPRSSTFKKYGVLQANSCGVIDESYKGDNDEWSFPCYATRDTLIPAGVRICQFRIIEHQPQVRLVQVEHLGNADRGGYGTTGD